MINAIFGSSVSTIGTSFDLLAGAFGLVGLVGGLVGYFAKGRSDAIIKAQAELIDVRDKQIGDFKESNAALSSENKVLAQQNETLTGLAQGSPQLIALTQEIKNLPKSLTATILRAMKETKK
jgi:hypothetical protein